MIQKMTKKGNIQDMIVIFFFIFLIAGLGLLFLKIMNDINEGFSGNAAGQEITQSILDQTREKLDGAIIIWTLVLIIGSWVSSFFLDNHPIYFIIFIFLSFVSFFIILPFTNATLIFLDSPDFANELQYLPMTYYIISHTAQFLAFYILTTSVMLYAKYKWVRA